MHTRWVLSAAAATVFCGVLLTAPTLAAAPAERYLHVQVSGTGNKGEDVNVNLPLSVAEKVLPTIDRGPLHQGRVTLDRNQLKGIDVPAIVQALRNSPDNKIVTVKDKDQNIDVSKVDGNIVVHVNETGNKGDNVSVTVPITVVDALFSTVHKDEIDVAGALEALDNAGDAFLVTVENTSEHVRVWVDSHNQPQ